MNILNIRIVFDRRGERKNNPKKLASANIQVLERGTKKKKYFYTGVKLLAVIGNFKPSKNGKIKKNGRSTITLF